MARKPEPTFVRELPCELSSEEFEQRATLFAKLDEKLAALEVKKKAQNDLIKEEIDEVEAERSKLRRIILARTEEREIKCQWQPDWASRSMLLRRLDTQQVVDTRTMTADEVQEQLPFEEGGGRRYSPGERRSKNNVAEAEIVPPAPSKPKQLGSGRKSRSKPANDQTAKHDA